MATEPMAEVTRLPAALSLRRRGRAGAAVAFGSGGCNLKGGVPARAAAPAGMPLTTVAVEKAPATAKAGRLRGKDLAAGSGGAEGTVAPGTATAVARAAAPLAAAEVGGGLI